MTIEEVGRFLESAYPCPFQSIECCFFGCLLEYPSLSRIVPVNLKEQDAFHLTIEEYLLSLTSMVEELVRAAAELRVKKKKKKKKKKGRR